jgi:hypothetical protein
MPEEINRIATDAIADLLWTPSPDTDDNLIKEGVAQPEGLEPFPRSGVNRENADTFSCMEAEVVHAAATQAVKA